MKLKWVPHAITAISAPLIGIVIEKNYLTMLLEIFDFS